MDEKPLRYQAYDAYARLIKAGMAISPKEFARRTEILVGEAIPHETIRLWVKLDGWANSVVVDGFEGSEELARILVFMASSLAVINNEDSSTPDISAAASEYRKMVSMLPAAFWPLLEDDIVKLRDDLFHLYNRIKGHIAHTTVSRVSSVWAELGRFVIAEAAGSSDATIPADSLVLDRRRY